MQKILILLLGFIASNIIIFIDYFSTTFKISDTKSLIKFYIIIIPLGALLSILMLVYHNKGVNFFKFGNLVTIFLATGVILSFIYQIVFRGEFPNIYNIIGIVLIIGGMYMIFL